MPVIPEVFPTRSLFRVPRWLALTKTTTYMVRTERLELSHLAAPEPKSGVSTNSTTSA